MPLILQEIDIDCQVFSFQGGIWWTVAQKQGFDIHRLSFGQTLPPVTCRYGANQKGADATFSGLVIIKGGWVLGKWKSRLKGKRQK